MSKQERDIYIAIEREREWESVRAYDVCKAELMGQLYIELSKKNKSKIWTRNLEVRNIILPYSSNT